jgi:hypothetical protein
MRTAGSFELSGVDGTNPLGFLAAVGTLVTLHRATDRAACLRWRRLHTWVPVIEGVAADTGADLARRIAAALQGEPVRPEAEQRRGPAQKAMEAAKKAVQRKRDEIRARKLGRAERAEAVERELRPLEGRYRERRGQWLEALRAAVPRPELALGKRIDCTADEYREHALGFLPAATHLARDPVDLLAAFGSDACSAPRSGAIQATPFCFITGAGHQFFLDTVRQLIGQVTPERVRQVLFEPWQYRDPELSMRWDPVEDRRYALLDRDPTASDNKPRTVWMANLLAYRALALFPAAPARGGLAVTGWNLDEDPPTFTWPLWEFAAGPDTVLTLLQLPGLATAQPEVAEFRARGIAAVYRAQRIQVGSRSKGKINFSQARAIA